ncbi:MAG: HlyD family efflux transporter periplasmic adaptor subunit, partial [Comamonadaceae bacterium]
SAGYRARQEILEREYAITSQLAKERLIPELEAVQRRKELEANRADLAGTQEGHRAALAAAQEARGKLAESEGRFRRRAAEELLAIERQIATTQEDHNRARNQRERTLVSAPITGFVKGLRSSEPGWVVKAGEPILDVVPGDAEIEVEARLSPSDRGLVLQGMPVRVKVTAYDFLRYGALDGDVRMIAADADHAEDKQSFFKMVVRTRGAVLGPAALPVTPGMQADVDVIVGHQPFVWYLLRPVLKIGAEAFREP